MGCMDDSLNVRKLKKILRSRCDRFSTWGRRWLIYFDHAVVIFSDKWIPNRCVINTILSKKENSKTARNQS